MTSSTPPTPNLGSDDIAWANELAATMITTALAVSAIDDNVEAEPLYAAARAAALAVDTADGLGADRWLAAMFFLSAHSAALLRQLGRVQGMAGEELWQDLLIRRAGRAA